MASRNARQYLEQNLKLISKANDPIAWNNTQALIEITEGMSRLAQDGGLLHNKIQHLIQLVNDLQPRKAR